MINKNKKAAASDEMMISIYRFLFLTFIAFVIMAVSGISYGYEIDLKNTDSMLMSRAIMDCITRNSAIDLDFFEENDLFDYCGFNEQVKDYYYVVLVAGKGEDFERKIVFGNEELEWVSYIFENNLAGENVEAYKPGYFSWEYPASIFTGEGAVESTLIISVVRKSGK